MRFVLWIGTDQPWEDVRATAGEADRSGWDGIYLADHFMPNEEPPGLEGRLEAWTALAGLASITQRSRLGVLVSGNTYRHPAILANMAATTDHVSNGRLVLGLGAGWQLSEHVAYGIELPEVPERLARLEEACQVITMLLTQERSDFSGRYYRLDDAPCEPKPLQAHLPLLLGVSGERVSMGIAARHADVWNCWGLPDLIKHKISVLDQHCDAAGRDPASIERSAQALVAMRHPGPSLDHWRERAAESTVPILVGTPDEIGRSLEEYAAIGLDEFVVSDRSFGSDTAERRERLQQFLEQTARPLRD